jgi:Uma2 family endonuclease
LTIADEPPIADIRADLTKAGIGVAAKKGAPKPDISTVEAFKRAMLAAKTIALDPDPRRREDRVGFIRPACAGRIPAQEVSMNIQLPANMDKAAFLAWVQERDGRYELVDGRVVMMVGASRTHGRIVRNLLVLLHEQLDPQRWEVIADLGFDGGPRTLRYPDIVVDEVAGAAGGDYWATAPLLMAEVLSPSTARIDLRDKATEYLRSPSLCAYLAFEQTEAKAWVWVRADEEFKPEPAPVAGRGESIQIPALNLVLPFADVYRGIQFA